MDPITLIPYTIFLLTMTGLWTKDEYISKEKCKTEETFIIGNSVYKCTEEQRLTVERQ